MLLYTASACNELHEFARSVEHLEKALEVQPGDLRIMFLLAQTHQKWAHHVLTEVPGLPPSAKTLEGSLRSLVTAKEKFQWLSEHRDDVSKVLDKAVVDDLDAHARWCLDAEPVANQHIESAREREAEKERIRREMAEEKEKEKKEAEEAEKQREAAKKEAAAKLKQLRRERREELNRQRAEEASCEAMAMGKSSQLILHRNISQGTVATASIEMAATVLTN